MTIQCRYNACACSTYHNNQNDGIDPNIMSLLHQAIQILSKDARLASAAPGIISLISQSLETGDVGYIAFLPKPYIFPAELKTLLAQATYINAQRTTHMTLLAYWQQTSATIGDDKAYYKALPTPLENYSGWLIPVRSKKQVLGVVIIAGQLADEDKRRAIQSIDLDEDIYSILSLLAVASKRDEYGQNTNALVQRFAHDMNNQLGHVTVSSYLLRTILEREVAERMLDSLSITKKLDVIDENAGYLTSLLRQLSNTMMMESESGSYRYSFSVTTIQNFIESVITKFERRNVAARDREIYFHNYLNEIHLTEIEHEAFERAIVNVLENACRYARRTVRVALVYSANQNSVVIMIGDDGRGIAPEFIDDIFEPYYTGGDSNSQQGLGLSITRDIVKAHHGKIRLYSKPDSGTIFLMFLPVISDKHDILHKEHEQSR